MHYIIHCLDHEGQAYKRLEQYESHKAYPATDRIKMLISGPLPAADGETMISSCFRDEAGSMDEATNFHRNNLIFAAGV